MRTDIHIHRDFLQYRDFITAIPEHKYDVEKVFCNRRNVVERVRCGEADFVIKRFRVPIWLNRFAYTFLRKSKAQRAFENALLLLEKGILTPEPVAYIIQKEHGLLHTAWFVSLHLPYEPVIDRYPKTKDGEEQDRLWRGVADFMLEAHRKKVIFMDNNGGNILVREEPEGLRFAIVDVNRLKCGHVPTMEEAMYSFEQLGVPISDFRTALAHYAEARGFDIGECLSKVARFREKRQRKVARKQRLKRMLGHSL